jgi:hypothetical protein
VVASDNGQALAGMIVAAYNLTGSLRGFRRRRRRNVGPCFRRARTRSGPAIGAPP